MMTRTIETYREEIKNISAALRRCGPERQELKKVLIEANIRCLQEIYRIKETEKETEDKILLKIKQEASKWKK